MSVLSAPNPLYQLICFRVPDAAKGLVKMRASQVEAFLRTNLTQELDTISLTLMLSACRAYLEVKHWLGDGGKPFEYGRVACAEVSI